MSGFAVGDRLETHNGAVAGTVVSHDPLTRSFRVVWDDGMKSEYGDCDLARFTKIGSAAVPAALQVGDVVEITAYGLAAIWAGYGVNAEAPFTVEEVLSYGTRIRDGAGRQFWVDKGAATRVEAASEEATPTCDCSARDLMWNGHRCGLGDSDPWSALAAVFQ